MAMRSWARVEAGCAGATATSAPPEEEDAPQAASAIATGPVALAQDPAKPYEGVTLNLSTYSSVPEYDYYATLMDDFKELTGITVNYVQQPVAAQDQKIPLQLSSSFCATATMQAMALVQQAAGTSLIRDEAGFEKLFRDANTIVQHAAVQTGRYESTGKVMFGLPSDWFPFNL